MEPSPKQILIVDDDPECLAMVAAALRLGGYRCLEAGTGAAALRLLKSEPCDLLITDIFLPDRDAFEIIGELKLRGLKMAVVAMSGLGEMGEVFKLARSFGASATLSKPFSMQRLRATVECVLAPDVPRGGQKVGQR